jgi:hypothetical protein
MKTVILLPCFVAEDPNGARFLRYRKWLDYNIPLMPNLGAEKIFMVDNCSNISVLSTLGGTILSPDEKIINNGNPNLRIYHMPSLKKEGKVKWPHLDYVYWWRALYFTNNLIAAGYDKIIFLDSDAFILTERLARYIKNLNSGWNTFWCSRHRFPETIIQVICRDKFNLFEEFTRVPYEAHNGTTAEIIIPFTNVCKDFTGDRYSEYGGDITQKPYMDYYTQALPHTPLTFNPLR